MFSFLKSFQKAALILAVLGLAACQSLDLAQTSIIESKTKQPLTLSELVQRIENVPLILLGEKHDNPAHHQAETALFKALQQRGKLQAVALEMLPSSEQPQIDQGLKTLRQSAVIDGAAVKQHLPWTQGWSWQQYRELLTALSQSSVQVLGGNLDRNEITTLFQGAYPLNGKISTQPAVKQRIAEEIAHHHKLAPSDAHIQTMVSVQQFKDRRMAEALIKGGKTLLIAGNFHVNKAVGVPLHLVDLGRKDFVVISLVKSLDEISPAEADYIWLLP